MPGWNSWFIFYNKAMFCISKKILKEEHIFWQVIPERADHIMGSASTFQRVPWFLSQYDFDVEGIPPSVEMFFNPTGHEALIQPIGRDFGEVVYRDGHHFCLAELWCLLIIMYMSKKVVSWFWWFYWIWCCRWILAKWQAQCQNVDVQWKRKVPPNMLTATSAFHK